MVNRSAFGKKLPSDKTLMAKRKTELIKLLHIAEFNYNVLVARYKIAIDENKCNDCPISIDTRKADRIKADTLDEFRAKIINYLEDSSDFADFVVTDNHIDTVIAEMKGVIK